VWVWGEQTVAPAKEEGAVAEEVAALVAEAAEGAVIVRAGSV
jgi:hypothetical protein